MITCIVLLKSADGVRSHSIAVVIDSKTTPPPNVVVQIADTMAREGNPKLFEEGWVIDDTYIIDQTIVVAAVAAPATNPALRRN